jgi:hypothetical protein
MNGIPFCQDIDPFLIPDEVGKFYAGPFKIGDGRFNKNDFVVMCRKMIVTIGLCQRQIESGRLNCRVQNFHVSEDLGAPDLEPTYIIRMIDDAHGIRVGINDTYLNGCFGQQKTSSCL